MRLKEIFKNLSIDSNLEIKDLSVDPRCIFKDTLFFIKGGKNFDIFSILNSINKENVSVFVASYKDKDKLIDLIKDKPVIFVKDIDREIKRISNLFYGFDNKYFKCIAITGTNGKTTTATLIWYLLKKLNKRASLISTVKYCIKDKELQALYTTPDYILLRKIFKEIKEANDEFVVMEASSHGIEQNRLEGIKFLRCIFTNLSRDHLDYHKTMTNYFNAKRKLFITNKNAIPIINIDDFYGRKLIREFKNSIAYGTRFSCDFFAKNIVLYKDRTEFDLLYKNNLYHIKSILLGRHNVLNILAAIACVSSLGFDIRDFIEFIISFKGADGRLEKVIEDIFVDYAHTPDALKKVLTTLREIGYKRIICVFGCGGNRDKGKRKMMGKIASFYADFSFVTSDNPRKEDPKVICRQIITGFKKDNYKVILDRYEAIKSAIKFYFDNKKDTCILIAGKGHEDYQIIEDKKIPFKDKEVVKEIIKNGNF